MNEHDELKQIARSLKLGHFEKGELHMHADELCEIADRVDQLRAEREGAEPVAEVESINPMNFRATVIWYPRLNGVPYREFNRIGAQLYTHPPAPRAAVPESVLESLWRHTKGVDPETGEAWLTPRMQREANRIVAHWKSEPPAQPEPPAEQARDAFYAGALSFKEEMTASLKWIFRPQIEGVFAVWQEKSTLAAQRGEQGDGGEA